MNNKVQVCGGGLKCDNPKCDYVDIGISMEDYKNWVNKPCPKCGEVLLTKQDYDAVQQILHIIGTVGNNIEVFEEDDGEACFMVEEDCGLYFHTIQCECGAKWIMKISGMFE